MSDTTDLSDNIRDVIESEPASNLDDVHSRRCSSDNYSGVEYTLYGEFITVRPIIDLFADIEDHSIESLSFADDGEQASLKIFVADTSEPPVHPAFTAHR